MSANAQMTAKGDAMYYVHSFLCLLIMFGFGQLPPVEPLTALGMRLIGIFLGLLYGWIFIDIVWPSMAGLLALMLVGGMKPVALLNRSFGDPIVVMMFFIFVFLRDHQPLWPVAVHLLVVHHPEVRCGQAVGIHLYVPGLHVHPRRIDQRFARRHHRLEHPVRDL